RPGARNPPHFLRRLVDSRAAPELRPAKLVAGQSWDDPGAAAGLLWFEQGRTAGAGAGRRHRIRNPDAGEAAPGRPGRARGDTATDDGSRPLTRRPGHRGL